MVRANGCGISAQIAEAGKRIGSHGTGIRLDDHDLKILANLRSFTRVEFRRRQLPPV